MEYVRRMKWPRVGALAFLVVEAIGGLVVGGLTAIIGEAITPGYFPWSFAAGPLFGAAAAVAVVAYWRRLAAAKYLAVAIQALVAFWSAIALITGSPPTLWLALVMGVAGTAIVALDTSAE